MPKTQTRRVPRRPKRPKKPVSMTQIRKNAKQIQDSFNNRTMSSDSIKAQIAALQAMLRKKRKPIDPTK